MKTIHLSLSLVLAFGMSQLDAQAPARPAAPPPAAKVSPLQAKLAKTILPKFELKEASLADAVGALASAVKAADPEKKAVDIHLAADVPKDQAQLTLSLSNVPAEEVLKFITNLSNTKYQISDTECVVMLVGK